MLRKDFLLQRISEYAEILAKIMRLRNEGHVAQALEQVTPHLDTTLTTLLQNGDKARLEQVNRDQLKFQADLWFLRALMEHELRQPGATATAQQALQVIRGLKQAFPSLVFLDLPGKEQQLQALLEAPPL